MDITYKILNFFLKRKEANNELVSLISLDKYLVNVEKEKEFLGLVLINKVKEMEKDDLVHSNNKKYYITEKGIVYLKENPEE